MSAAACAGGSAPAADPAAAPSPVPATAAARAGGRTLDQRLDDALKPVPNGVRVTTTVTTYEIGGATVAEARQMMAREGMRDERGRRWAGFTRWRVNWRWEYESGSGGCRFKDVTVNLALQVDVPRLSGEAMRDSTLRAWYEGWFDRLFQHEAGHARIARDGAREIHQRLRFLQGTACDDLGNRANQLARGILDTFNDRQAAYDANTAHGARPAGVAAPRAP